MTHHAPVVNTRVPHVPQWMRDAAQPFWTITALAVGGLAAALLNVILARNLSPDRYGLVSNVQSVAMFALGFVTLGKADAVQRILVPGQDPATVPWGAVVNDVAIRNVLPMAAVVALAAGLWYRWPPSAVLCAAGLLAGTGVATMAGNAIRAADSPAVGQWIVQAWRIVSLAAVGAAVIVLNGRMSTAHVLVILAVTALGAAGLGLAAVYRPHYPQAIPNTTRRALRSEGRTFVGINASLALLSYLDQLIVPAVLGMAAFGRYAAAWWIIGAPLLLLQAGIGFTLQPQLRRAADTRVARHALVVQGSLLLATSALTAVAAGGLAPLFLDRALGHDYVISGWTIAAIALGGWFRAAYALPSSVIGAWGDEQELAQLNRIGWAVAGLAVPCTWLGAVYGGLTGVAVGVAVGLGARMVAASVLARSSLVRRLRAPVT